MTIERSTIHNQHEYEIQQYNTAIIHELFLRTREKLKVEEIKYIFDGSEDVMI